MLTMEEIQTPITVGKHSHCVLQPESVQEYLDKDPDYIPTATPLGGVTAYIRESIVLRTRKSSPDAQLHGVWSILLLNKLITPGDDVVYILPRELSPSNGAYIWFVKGKVVEAGFFADDFLPSENVLGVDAELDQIKTVLEAIRTPTEVIKDKRLQTRKSLIRHACVTGAASVVAVAALLATNFEEGLLKKQHQTLLSDVATIKGKNDKISQSKATDQMMTDRDYFAIQRVFELAQVAQIESMQTVELASANWTAIIGQNSAVPGWAFFLEKKESGKLIGWTVPVERKGEDDG